MAQDNGHNIGVEKIFNVGLPVTFGQESGISAYGVVKELDVEKGVVIVTDLNGTKNKEARWPIQNVFAQP